MDKFTVRFAEKKDISKIMIFINEHWKRGHILAVNRELFEWQYVHYGRVCFVIGCDADEQIQGILGYIPYDNTAEKNIAIALWKANASDRPFLGIELLDFLLNNESYKTIMCVGINPKTTDGIYRRFGMKVGMMRQWYRLGKREKYDIAEIHDNYIPEITAPDKYSLCRFPDFAQFANSFDCKGYKERGCFPFKSMNYIRKRYFEHPIYNYEIYGVDCGSRKTDTAIVLRVQELGEKKALRFVDCIGDPKVLPYITGALDKLLDSCGAEYIDIYEAGVPEELLRSGGWIPVQELGNIIPNYFSPYEPRNVDVFYSENSDMILFRGDGDQDRPNQVT